MSYKKVTKLVLSPPEPRNSKKSARQADITIPGLGSWNKGKGVTRFGEVNLWLAGTLGVMLQLEIESGSICIKQKNSDGLYQIDRVRTDALYASCNKKTLNRLMELFNEIILEANEEE